MLSKMVCPSGLFPAGRKTSKEPVDLRLSVMKPLGAKWLVELHDYIKGKPDIIKNGFKEAGIPNCTA